MSGKSHIMVDSLFTLESRDSQAFRVGARNGHQWCHMWCNPGDEEALHALAAKIGLKRSWAQLKPGFVHYDLVPSRRALAIKAGAVETDLREWLRSRRFDQNETDEEDFRDGCLNT
jgi:hypothetical protein